MSKRAYCWLNGLCTTGMGVLGGALLVVGTGGTALLVGGLALGAGISGTTNCV
jgi:hypothetical protein